MALLLKIAKLKLLSIEHKKCLFLTSFIGSYGYFLTGKVATEIKEIVVFGPAVTMYKLDGII
jgi:hypothetical protein